MIVGIVGAEGRKFTPENEAKAREVIRGLFTPNVTEIVSGRCPAGGIDIWAVEEAKAAGIITREFAPKNETWMYGYRPRNMQIAIASDLVVCITPRSLPEDYKFMGSPYCYHCQTINHVRSGGCWTMHQAIKLGKQSQLVVIE